MKSLAELVQNLPPELYNEVYKLTFTATAVVVQIDRAYKPPSCLQVSRVTRDRFARPYYGPSIFYIHKTLLAQWTKSLPRRHHSMPHEIRVHDDRPHQLDYLLTPIAGPWLRIFTSQRLLAVRRECRPWLIRDALKVKVGFDNCGEERWLSYDDVLKPLF